MLPLQAAEQAGLLALCTPQPPSPPLLLSLLRPLL